MDMALAWRESARTHGTIYRNDVSFSRYLAVDIHAFPFASIHHILMEIEQELYNKQRHSTTTKHIQPIKKKKEERMSLNSIENNKTKNGPLFKHNSFHFYFISDDVCGGCWCVRTENPLYLLRFLCTANGLIKFM